MPTGVGPTPDRATRLVLRPGTQPKLISPYWHITRAANEIGVTGVEQTVPTVDAVNLGAGWFISTERRWITSGNDPFLSKANGEVETVDDGFDISMFRKNTLTGVGADASVNASGINAIRRRVPAGGTFNKSLSDDAASFISPTIPGALTPMNRIMHTKITFKQNRPIGFVLWDLHDDAPSADTFFGIAFGGRNSTLPAGKTRGGEFYLGVKTDGSAYLYELNNLNTWDLIAKMKAFNKSSDNRAKSYQVYIVPVDDRTIHFGFERKVSIFESDDEDTLGGSYFRKIGIAFGRSTGNVDTYTHNVRVRRYTPVGGITGNGAVRIDARRDLRGPFSIAGLKFKASGYVTDVPFAIADEIPAGTPIRIRIYGFTPFGTSIEAQLYNGETGTALTQLSFAYGGDSGVGIYTFASAAGIKKYFVRFLLLPNADKTRTPVLYGYDASVAAVYGSQSTTPASLGQIMSLRTTGPDFDGGQDSASLNLTSIYNTHESLRQNGHIEAQINVYNTQTAALRSIIFEGEIIRPEFTQVSAPTSGYPYVRDWDISMKSMWGKIERYINQQNRPLNPEDNREPRSADGQWWPNRVTSVIQFILLEVGFEADQIGIPDIGLRFWPSPGGGSNHLIWKAGDSAADLIQYLAMRYLNATVVWAPNSGSRGKWQLAFNPYGTPTTSLASFYSAPAANKYASSSGAYSNGTFILRKTYKEEVIPPAANKIKVIGLGSTGKGGSLVGSGPAPAGLIEVTEYNKISYPFFGPGTADSTHIDYIGEVIPFEVFDPTLGTIEAVQWFARTLMRQIGHGRRMAKWRSPLFLVTDAGDASQVRPRPLRFGDPVTLRGSPAWVRSCNISIPKTDKIQMMDMEAWYA